MSGEKVVHDSRTYWLSLDPGVNMTGLTVSDVTDSYQVIKTYLVKNNRSFTPEEKVLEKTQGPRAVKILAIVNKVKEILAKHSIDVIVIEAPFYNRLTPQAYGSLLEVIFALKYMVLVPEDRKYLLIEPTLVKKLFTGHGMAKKEAMKQFLISKKEAGLIQMDLDIETLSEHEIDSVAIGFVHWVTQQLPKSEV